MCRSRRRASTHEEQDCRHGTAQSRHGKLSNPLHLTAQPARECTLHVYQYSTPASCLGTFASYSACQSVRLPASPPLHSSASSPTTTSPPPTARPAAPRCPSPSGHVLPSASRGPALLRTTVLASLCLSPPAIATNTTLHRQMSPHIHECGPTRRLPSFARKPVCKCGSTHLGFLISISMPLRFRRETFDQSQRRRDAKDVAAPTSATSAC